MAQSCRPYSTRGWRAPTTKAGRQRMLEAYGAKCFLQPSKLKYPVCSPRGKVSCGGLLVAKRRAAQYGQTGLVKKADQMAKKIGCCWAK